MNRLLSRIINVNKKNSAEIRFWSEVLMDYIAWYDGNKSILYGEKSPSTIDKVIVSNKKDSAILTWEKIHQQNKYLEDLNLDRTAFEGMRILDIGSGPHPSARVFNNVELYCLEPLLPYYLIAGYPLHYYDNVKFVVATAENMPFSDYYFDAIISVNSLDHVNDFELVVSEIKRVLKKNGKIRMHLHYHSSTLEEPISLNDEKVSKSFSWCREFKKIKESKVKRGTTLKGNNEKYVLWSNW